MWIFIICFYLFGSYLAALVSHVTWRDHKRHNLYVRAALIGSWSGLLFIVFFYVKWRDLWPPNWFKSVLLSFFISCTLPTTAQNIGFYSDSTEFAAVYPDGDTSYVTFQRVTQWFVEMDSVTCDIYGFEIGRREPAYQATLSFHTSWTRGNTWVRYAEDTEIRIDWVYHKLIIWNTRTHRGFIFHKLE